MECIFCTNWLNKLLAADIQVLENYPLLWIRWMTKRGFREEAWVIMWVLGNVNAGWFLILIWTVLWKIKTNPLQNFMRVEVGVEPINEKAFLRSLKIANLWSENYKNSSLTWTMGEFHVIRYMFFFLFSWLTNHQKGAV